MANVYSVCESELTVPQALAIVNNVDTEKVSTRVTQKPLGSQVFVYSLENSVTKDDWLADGYRWINNGTARLPIREATVLKRKFKAWTPDGGTTDFKRLAYSSLLDSTHIVVQYVGDASCSVEGCHGNRKLVDQQVPPFKRTAPSVIMRIAEKTMTGKNPMGIYQEEVASGKRLYMTFIERR
jgi:hypothetical protein